LKKGVKMRLNAQQFDPDTHVGPLPSPCVGICTIDRASSLCQGCWRTMDEIVAWGVASEEQKRAIWLALKQRAQSI
jgi:predicted Fe-S protein YdhL (DUF1289 family)